MNNLYIPIIISAFFFLLIILFILKLISSSAWRDAYVFVKDDPDLLKKILRYKNSIRGVNIITIYLKENEILGIPPEARSHIMRKKKIDYTYSVIFLVEIVLALLFFFFTL